MGSKSFSKSNTFAPAVSTVEPTERDVRKGASMPSLTGKTVLLTGASRGIGKQTARVLGESGAHVIAHYAHSLQGAEEATAEIPDDRKLLLQANFEEPGTARMLWKEALGWRGRVDVVVNNAAVMPEVAMGEPDEAWDEAWSTALQVNVVEPANLIREALPHFVANGGGILITLSSWVAYRGAGNAKLTAYAASKAALTAMAKTVASEYARNGVLVYNIAPGTVRTEMSYQAAKSLGGEEVMAAQLAMGEWVPPQEIAELIVFLASGMCRHLSGATLDVNGASYMR